MADVILWSCAFNVCVESPGTVSRRLAASWSSVRGTGRSGGSLSQPLTGGTARRCLSRALLHSLVLLLSLSLLFWSQLTTVH